MELKINPLRKLYLVENVENIKHGTLWVPQESASKIAYGRVIRSSPDGDNLDGQYVIYSIYGTNEIRDGGKKLLLIPEKEIFATVEGLEIEQKK